MSDETQNADKATISFWIDAPRPCLIAEAKILPKSFSYEELWLSPPWSLRFKFVDYRDDEGIAQLQRLCDALLNHCYTGSTTVNVRFVKHTEVYHLRFKNAYVLSMSPIKYEDQDLTVECLLRFYERPTRIESVHELVY